MSSAYTKTLILSTATSLLMRSSMKIKKRSGPRTEPWETPLVTWLGIDKDLFTRVFWVLPDKKSAIHFKIDLLISKFFNTVMSLLCGTESKALAKSRYMMSYRVLLSWAEKSKMLSQRRSLLNKAMLDISY